MSAQNDMTRIVRESSKAAGSSVEYTGDPKVAAQSLIRRPVSILVAGINANGSNEVAPNANPTQFRAPANGRVLTCHFVPSVAATEHATNYASMNGVITQANGVGAGRTVATQTTKPVANSGVGTLAPGAAVALTVTDIANARFVKGEVLSGSLLHVSGGVVMGAGVIQYLVELEGPCDDVGI